MFKLRILVMLSFVIFMPVNLFAAVSNELMAAYHEQYDQYTKEMQSLQITISDYENCMSENDSISQEFTELYGKRLNYEISKVDEAKEKIRLYEAQLNMLKKCQETYNKSKGESRTNISMNDINYDLDYSRKRMKELNEKKQELKIKILEGNGALPAWWVK